MTEKAKYIHIDGKKIYTIQHIPDRAPIKGAFVFIHPFAEEKLWSHRVYVSFAREMVQHGYLVVRFDFRGHGDSETEFVCSSLEDHISDIDCVITTIKSDFEISQIGLFGLRFGATLSAIYASSSTDISRLILWDPVINGERYMQEILRSNLATQMAIKGKVEITRDELINQMQSGKPINIDGYLLTHNYFLQLSALKLLELNYHQSTQCIINQIVKNPKQPLNKLYQELVMRFSGNSTIKKSHEEQFWKEIKTFYQNADNLTTSSIEWLTATQ
ncbi:MAG: alpha/beta hydrolase [Candidatus Thiodiazotropha sp. (ex Cardiolucina cf. quadrata)]|nr:alpha/beta hydrolase [Candidatus Thiodiazotropha sp. (ex Cardiolucina cf. quadrata)]